MKKSIVISLHLGYWIIYSLLLLVVMAIIREGFHSAEGWDFFSTLFLLFTVVPAVISFYSFYTFLFTRLLQKKKILVLCGACIGVSLLSAFVAAILLSLVFGTSFMFADNWTSFYEETIAMAVIGVIHGVIALVMRGFITWYGDIKIKEELTRKNFEMELALVKSQVNPHFLFNTINNIDVLIEKDPAMASGYLNKLSDIMRFMLYETKTEKIALEKELAYITKYIDLQKIRTSNTNYVSYSVEGDPSNLSIAPMLFIPFIENAFKHAENKKHENAINIKFMLGKGKIIFECANSYVEKTSATEDQSGVGNELIRKRLNLLYPETHTLDVSGGEGTYLVKLFLYGREN